MEAMREERAALLCPAEETSLIDQARRYTTDLSSLPAAVPQAVDTIASLATPRTERSSEQRRGSLSQRMFGGGSEEDAAAASEGHAEGEGDGDVVKELREDERYRYDTARTACPCTLALTFSVCCWR